ncbi:MAG: SIS domain-containing protein [Bacteroidota bacterium]
MQNVFRADFLESQQVFETFLSQASLFENLEKAAVFFIESIRNGGKIISCGNGGSMTDAMHFAEELSGKYQKERKALPAIAISDPSHITCVANDYGFEYVFSRFVESVGNEEDTLLVISTSGKSPNIINAVQSAHKLGMSTVALTGNKDAEVLQMVDVGITVPHGGYSDRIQEVHTTIIHALIHVIKQELL